MPLYSQKRRGNGVLCFHNSIPGVVGQLCDTHDMIHFKTPNKFSEPSGCIDKEYTFINCVHIWFLIYAIVCIDISNSIFIRIYTSWKRVHLILGCLLWEGDLDPANVGSSALSLCGKFRQKLCGSDTVDGRNPANKLIWKMYRYLPVEVGSFSHYLQVFIHSMWCCRTFSINRM